jgi:hypothetical protein
MAALSPAQIAERLTLDDDPQVSSWAARVGQRVAARQVSLTREYGRLLAPLVDAGLVISSPGGFEITLTGHRAVRDMLADDREIEPVAA